MITDLVFLKGVSPDELMGSEDIYELGSWFNAKNIDTIPLSQLGEMLGVSSYKELMKGFYPAVDPEGEAVLLTFPTDLQQKLSSITDEEIAAVAPKWAKIEEFHGNAPVEIIVEYLTKVREFLSNSEEPVYLFWAA